MYNKQQEHIIACNNSNMSPGGIKGFNLLSTVISAQRMEFI